MTAFARDPRNVRVVVDLDTGETVGADTSPTLAEAAVDQWRAYADNPRRNRAKRFLRLSSSTEIAGDYDLTVDLSRVVAIRWMVSR